MTNAEKYKTAKERAEAFFKWCKSKDDIKMTDSNCKSGKCLKCSFEWLDLEAEAEEPLPCPFCGCDDCCVQTDPSNNKQLVWCENCGYSTGSNFTSDHAAIAAHNRVARAAKEVSHE